MANKTVTVKSASGDYTTLNAALAGESANLVTGTCILTIECYAMQDTTAAGTGTGYTTNASYYINIVAPAGNRHTGIRSTSAYRLEPTVNYGWALTIEEAYTRVTYLQIRNASAFNSGALNVDATNCLIRECLVYDTEGASSDGRGIVGGQTTNYFINCIVLNCIDGFRITENSNIVYNCVSLNNTGYGFQITGFKTLVAKNCYAGANGTDYQVDTNGTLTKTTCHASDTTGNTQTACSTSSGAYFTNVTAGTENIHIGASSALIGVGTDLHADGTFAFNTDIDGETRPDGAWDVGADEYVAAGGGTVVPVFMNQYRQRRS